MRRSIITGIDIGSYHVKVVISEIQKGTLAPRVIGTGAAASRGLRHGYITNSRDIVESINEALSQAQSEAGVSVTNAYLAIGGVGLDDIASNGEAIISRADSHVSNIDTENAIADAESRVAGELINRRIIHAIPISYTIDNTPVLGRPIGMRGSKIEVEALFITVLEQHVDDLIATVESAGIEVVDVMASPIAASLVTLTKQQKMAGCMLANIGAETVSTVIFEENAPISLKVFPIGSSDITNDIALELKVPLNEAEQIKRGSVSGANYTQKKLDDIVARRMKDIFTLIQNHLKKINRAGLLPAGIILTGGGAGATTLEDYARAALKLPSEIASTRIGGEQLKDSTWAVAYGLCLWGASSDTDTPGIAGAKETGAKMLQWFKQFLP